MRKVSSFLVLLYIIILQNDVYAQTVTDVDGNIYNTITIGGQEWMRENLKVTKYSNGDIIGTTTPDTLDITTQPNPKYLWFPNGNNNAVSTYGLLYTWYAATDSRGVCPTGWHLPSHDEWTTLERELCVSASCNTDFPFDLTTTGYRGTNEGGKLKETDTLHWLSPNTGATNISNFTALPSGRRESSGSFYPTGANETLWSATEYTIDTTRAWDRDLHYNGADVGRGDYSKKAGFSVRCLANGVNTGINKTIPINLFQVYPNPATNQLFVQSNGEALIEVNIYNTTGSLVSQTKQPQTKSIDISQLANGVYIAEVKIKEASVMRRWVKM